MKKKILLSIVAVLCIAVAMVAVACTGSKGGTLISLNAQTDILKELNAGTADVGVMDSVMAGYYVKKDTNFSKNLQIVENLTLAEEKYGIGFRKGSAIADKVNTELSKLSADKTIAGIAETYGVSASLLEINYTSKWDSIADKSDWDKVVAKGEIIVGYTVFAPVAYEENGKLIGFDITLAEKVFANLGLKVKFVEIDWLNKIIELNDGKIDCIWNGMTILEKLAGEIDFSVPYLSNTQCAVIKKSNAEKYKTIEQIKTARIAAESASAGEAIVKELLGIKD